MIRVIAVAVALTCASQAIAADVILTIRNESTHAIVALNSYPIDDDGVPVEDNIGALMEDVAPGASTTLALDGRCGNTFLLVGIEGQDEDLEHRVDTCKDRTLVLRD